MVPPCKVEGIRYSPQRFAPQTIPSAYHRFPALQRGSKNALPPALVASCRPDHAPIREICPPRIGTNTNSVNPLRHAMNIAQLVDPHSRRVVSENAIRATIERLAPRRIRFGDRAVYHCVEGRASI